MIGKIVKNQQWVNAEIVRLNKKERQRLARELHDEMGQYLTAIHLYASSILRISETSSINNDANAIDRISFQIMDVIHNKINGLRSLSFVETSQSFSKNIGSMIQSWEVRNAGVLVDIDIKNIPTEVNNKILFTIYRLIQECLTNISRHAKASHVAIRVEIVTQNIILSVVDNGDGFNLDNKIERLGIVGMKERVMEFGGEFSIVTSIGAGVIVKACLPCRILD